MNEETNNQPDSANNSPQTNSGVNAVPLMSPPSGRKVLQPSDSLKQEMQAQQVSPSQSVQAAQPVPQSIPAPSAPLELQSTYPSSMDGQIPMGMSASQMGMGQSKAKLLDFDPKKLIIKGVIGLAAVFAVLVILVMTNIIALSEFKTVGYTNSKGASYKLDFYTKHVTRRLATGNTQLVSKVSKGNKFPLAFSIDRAEMSGYNRIKNCGSYSKVLDVQNDNINQKISICDLLVGMQAGNRSMRDGVYAAGFVHNGQAHIITIAQDYGGIDLSSQAGAIDSLSKFGLDTYRQDIEKIVSSIRVD